MRNERGCERRRVNKERAVKQGDNMWKERPGGRENREGFTEKMQHNKLGRDMSHV